MTELEWVDRERSIYGNAIARLVSEGHEPSEEIIRQWLAMDARWHALLDSAKEATA